MDIIYKLGKASASEVHDLLPADVTYSTVRAKLRVLEEKGHVRHEEQGPRYVYFPLVGRDKARKSALRHLVDTFFEGSAEQVVATLLDGSSSRVGGEELNRLAALIEEAKRKGA
jgi:predicted transcriptional regulator